MATQIPGTVIASLAAKLDTLDPAEEEHAALAVVLAAGLARGRERPEVEGFMPTAVEMPAAGKFAAQLNPTELLEVEFSYQSITVNWGDGSAAASDDWEARI